MTSPASPAPQPRLPLFYRDPRPLSSVEHAQWRLLPGDLGFAAETPFVPILLGELAEAARHYPIVFAATDAFPIALLGLDRTNLYVQAGRWEEGAYVPAYVRRYPFGVIQIEPEQFMLAVDAASERLARAGEAGVALFQDGAPSDETRSAMTFCEAFQAEGMQCEAFGVALRAHDLLVDQRVDATLADGRPLAMQGFQIVDAERFHRLPEAVMLDWQSRGWLRLIIHHLASLDRFERLLARQNRLEAPVAIEPAVIEEVQ